MIACIVRVATTVFVAGTLAGAGENQVGQGATMVWEVLIERPRHQVWTAVTTPDAVGSWLVGAVTVAATPGGRVVLSLGPDSDTYGARVVEVQEGVHLAAVIDRVPETSDHSGPLLGTRWTLSLSAASESTTLLRLSARRAPGDLASPRLRAWLEHPVLLALWGFRVALEK